MERRPFWSQALPRGGRPFTGKYQPGVLIHTSMRQAIWVPLENAWELADQIVDAAEQMEAHEKQKFNAYGDGRPE